jgi:probable rRNA maturation factor
MHIDIHDQTDRLSGAHQSLLEEVLQFTAQSEKIPANVELSITIVTNETIQKMNQQYRHKNEATDVLSFEVDHPFDDFEAEAVPLLMGDIVISYEKVEEQCKRYNHSFERELTFLAIHGFLHLMGYTHDTIENERSMFQKQDAILEAFHLER